jgi:hypothetical protein
MSKRTSTALIAGLILAAGASLGACVPAEAETHQMQSALTQTPRAALVTGLVGVASGQYARLHVTRLHPPDPVEPVELSLALIGADGEIVAHRRVALAPGASAYVDARGPRVAGRRALVRASIVGSNPPDDSIVGGVPPDDGIVGGVPPDDSIVGGVPPDDNLAGILATLEIVDIQTGSTAVVMNPLVIKGFNPQPEPPAVVAN